MKTMMILAILIVILFYIPMFKWFSEIMMGLTKFGVALYWILLTLLSILIGFKILEKMFGGGAR